MRLYLFALFILFFSLPLFPAKPLILGLPLWSLVSLAATTLFAGLLIIIIEKAWRKFQ